MDLNTILVKSIQSKNLFLGNNYIRFIILMITGVFMGYTLQPVPKWLDNLFNNSHIFKFIVLFLAGAVAVYPITQENIMWIFVASVGTMVIFEMFRKLDDRMDKNAPLKVFRF
jgi:4-hydroxybenzoate polyprenyltransferase